MRVCVGRGCFVVVAAVGVWKEKRKKRNRTWVEIGMKRE